MYDVAIHLLVILLIGLPVVEWTARRLRRLYIDGNSYRSIALLVHIVAFTIAEWSYLPVGAIFAVSIAAILMVYASYELGISRQPAAQAARARQQEQAIWAGAWSIYRQRVRRRAMVVVATYQDAHAQELMRRDGERLTAAGIPYQQHYVLMGSTLVPPQHASAAREILAAEAR